jgi:hypothetical protein
MKKLKDLTTQELNISGLMKSKELSQIKGGYPVVAPDCHNSPGIRIECPGGTCTGGMCTGGLFS